MSERASAEIGIKKVTWRFTCKGRLVSFSSLLGCPNYDGTADVAGSTAKILSCGILEARNRAFRCFPRSSLPAKRQGAAIEGGEAPKTVAPSRRREHAP